MHTTLSSLARSDTDIISQSHVGTRVICDPLGSTGCLRCECKQISPHMGAALERQSSQGEIEKENLVVYMLSGIPYMDKAW